MDTDKVKKKPSNTLTAWLIHVKLGYMLFRAFGNSRPKAVIKGVRYALGLTVHVRNKYWW